MREFANRSLGAMPGTNEMLIETLYAHGFLPGARHRDAKPSARQIPASTPPRSPMQEAENTQKVAPLKSVKMEQDREASRLAEARVTDELTPQDERLAVCARGPQTTISLKRVATRRSKTSQGRWTGEARRGRRRSASRRRVRFKSAADHYLQEEAAAHRARRRAPLRNGS